MSINKTKNAAIQYGKKDRLKDSDFEARNIGHRISIVVPEDVIMAFRKAASEQGIGYQTLMNQSLRNHITGANKIEASKIEASKTEDRLERLEKAVFRQIGRRNIRRAKSTE